MNFQDFYLLEDIKSEDDIFYYTEASEEEYLLEYTYTDIRNMNKNSKPRQKSSDPSKKHFTRYKGYDKYNNILYYETISQTHPYKGSKPMWTQKIRLLSLPETIKNTEKPLLERVKQAVQGEIQVECNCPSFLYYGYRYMLTNSKMDNRLHSKTKSVLGLDEFRAPNIRNPIVNGRRDAVTCKHLDAVLWFLPFNIDKIVNSLKTMQ